MPHLTPHNALVDQRQTVALIPLLALQCAIGGYAGFFSFGVHHAALVDAETGKQSLKLCKKYLLANVAMEQRDTVY